MGERLQNAAISYNAKHPIILLAQNPFSKLLVKEFHVTHLHAGVSLLLHILRQNYCIIKGRRLRVASHSTVDSLYENLMGPYTSEGTVNGIEIKILRDTGATLDLICSKSVEPQMYTSEKVWLRTPLD